MPDNPRIDELRSRVEKDSASIAFAQLAEEYRRAGHFEEAINTCRAGLAVHPAYLSARVTLGRSLLEMNALEDAATELLHVLRIAPENLAAIRGMAEIHHRQGHLDEALGFYKTALGLARHDPDLEQTIDDINRAIQPSRPEGGFSFEQMSAEFISASPPPAPEVSSEVQPEITVLPELERFLEAISAYRQRLAS